MAEAFLERVDPETLLVHRDPVERQVEDARECLHAGIRERFGQHAISRPGERREDRHHRVLGAGADEHLSRMGGESEAGGPRRTGAAMAEGAGVRLVAQEIDEVGFLGNACGACLRGRA